MQRDISRRRKEYERLNRRALERSERKGLRACRGVRAAAHDAVYGCVS